MNIISVHEGSEFFNRRLYVLIELPGTWHSLALFEFFSVHLCLVPDSGLFSWLSVFFWI